jgi:hypothetical protein
MKNSNDFKVKFFKSTLVIAVLSGIASCNNYQNPGNNTGKTGDGTGADSLKAKKNDTGKGANRLNLIIKRDSTN